ncbi:sugar ABC transporter permease [uncultured Acetatifactor sp.]|uniref:ABC transporter permease n=1 Tax=uncultured Acetatifactor sp. TaxID=1671927 RepID=UPI0025E652AE|nr:ABC transporter permease subunit [uncultured Acetatifactor sp.]MCI8695710.1 sugar ABC transporter permease [Lachnospiraceae bacterium]MCI9232561.1 sugar ABC transporter permease [Lachnospiraceae bacterium]MCI9651324.1 sugar ABC transporter permease [Lachnospiraceae bacterium]
MVKGKRKGKAGALRRIGRCWQLYVLMLPALVYIVLFAYKPMYGILIAFKDFSMKKGILASPWVGFKNFERLFSSYWFPIILKNTLTISLLSLVIGFPIPIILALLLNEVRSNKFRSMVQTFSYAPHFISMVVMCGMVAMFLSPTTGVVNKLLNALGMESVFFMQEAGLFKWVYVLSGVWQGTGWSSVIYFAALSGVDKSLLEAADMDGATRLQKIWHVNLPVILPTILVMLILQCGSLLSVGYEKAYLLQTSSNLTGSEIISTYVYKVGLVQSDFSFSTAAGLFNTVVNCIILISANQLSKKVAKTGLF